MIAEWLVPAVRELPEFDILLVGGDSTRDDFVGVTSSVFYVPPVVAHRVYGSARYWNGTMVGCVRYAEGRPVCTAASNSGAGAVGVYCVATGGGPSGRGYAERITRYALDRAGAARTILQFDADRICRSTSAWAATRRPGLRSTLRGERT